MRYKWVNENELVLDTENNASIPVGNGTASDLEFQNWIREGNEPDAADEEIEPIKYISKLTIVDRLEAIGKRALVKAALANNEYANDRWNAATEIAINDTQVIELLTACGIDAGTILY